jgi:hypothetical protein
MKSNLLLKELENNVPMESLNVQFQVGRGKGAAYSTGQLSRKRAENGLKAQERLDCFRQEFGFEVAG